MFEYFKQKKELNLFLGKDEESILHLGDDTKGRPIWLSPGMLRTHMVITGSTGSGKTETLIGMMANAFAWGSGGIFVDGKGDVNVFAKMATLAQKYGRQDDLYVINFMNSGPNDRVNEGFTHRFNPFEKGNPDAMTQMIVGCLETGDYMWKGRTVAMLTGLMPALCWRRDNVGAVLNAATIREHIHLKALIDISQGKMFKEIPEQIRNKVSQYLESLPGFVEERGYNQAQTTLDQHGFVEMQLTKFFSTMSDVYPHIFTDGPSDINMEDIITNRRFLCVLLPALEKAHDEISYLGKIIVASLKMMTGAMLGKPISGRWDDYNHEKSIVMQQPPFMVILDEASYYMVDGYDLLAAQSRSLNISMIFACHSIASLMKSSSNVGRGILQSANTKIIMRDPTWAHEMDSVYSNASPGRDDVIPYMKKCMKYAISRNKLPTMGSIASRLDAGEFIMMSSGNLLFGKALYVNPKPDRGMRLALAKFRSQELLAEELVRLSYTHTANVDTASDTEMPLELTPLPRSLETLCSRGESNPVFWERMMKAALSGIANAREETKKTQAVALGE